MADYKSYGTINYWTRSTDLRNLGECPMKWLLTRLYPPDRDKGYYHFGTGLHFGIECAIRGATLKEATDEALLEIVRLITEAKKAGRPVEWTSKRPEEGWTDLAEEMMSQWWIDVMPPEGTVLKGMAAQMPFYRDREPIALEFTADTNMGAGVVTEIDSIWKRKTGVPGYDIVDWKTGSTAKADSLQLWVYNYGARHTPGGPLYGVKPEMVGMWYHHLAFSKLQPADRYPGDDYMRKLLIYSDLQRQLIHSEGFAPAKPDWYCNYCQSKMRCPVVGTGNLTTIMEDAKIAPVEITRPD